MQETKDIRPFRSNAAETRYSNYTIRQALFMERGLTCSDSESNPLVTQVIKSHEWETFCQHPSCASIPFVREFYANYDAAKPDSVYIRGKLVDVSSSAINSFFSLTDHENTFFKRSSNLSFMKMCKILKELTEPGTQWSSKEDLTFPRRSLKASTKIWFKFIKYNLLPASDDKLVEKDTAILLYCIMVGKPINVGEVIAKQIGVCAGLRERGLWFPSLITRLCTQNNAYLSHINQMKEYSDPLYVKSQSDDEKSDSDEGTSQSDQETNHSDDEKSDSDEGTSQSDQETNHSDEETGQADQQTSKSDHDPSSPITISSDQSRDDIMLISSGNSGDDEPLDVEQESFELAEDVSPMSDCAQSVEHGEKSVEQDEQLVGSRIKVWRPEDKTYYEGVVKSFNCRKKKHKVLYDVGEEEFLNLKKEQWELIENPTPMPDCAKSVKHGENLVGSKIEVSSPLNKDYHEGDVKSFDRNEKKHKVLIDDKDDGVELLNLKKEHGELLESVSPMSDCLQSGITCVHGYKVKESVGPILESIFKKHGDIAAECVFKTDSEISSLLESVCDAVTQIQTSDFTEKIEEIERNVLDAEKANINVSWIRAYLDTIHKMQDSKKKSSLLMETKANTVLVSVAAQKDLIEKCEELVAAQERFAMAERCVRVLHLVNKNLSNNILESKESWVQQQQPIL